MRTVAIVQARMSSTRLPGKVLADIRGEPMLQRVLEQAGAAELADCVVVATTEDSSDDPVATFCGKAGFACFRGSEQDVLDRFYQAASRNSADAIVRLTADCPLLDPEVIDRVIARFRSGAFDYVSNSVRRTFPDGLDTEVFTFGALERAWKEAAWSSEREHVTPYIWKHPEIFRLEAVLDCEDRSNLRWTVDQKEDLDFVRAVYERLGGGPIRMGRVLDLLQKEPGLARVNEGIECNEGYRKSIREDRWVKAKE